MKPSNYCQLHTNKTFEFVCIAHHQCEKRFCSECSFQHEKQQKDSNCIPNNVFLQKISEVIDPFINNELKQESLKNHKVLFSNQQKQFSFLFEQIIQTLTFLYDEASKLTIELQNIKNLISTQEINDLSLAEINYLLNALNYSGLDKINQLKNQLPSILSQITNEINQSFQKLYNKIQQFIHKEESTEEVQYDNKIWTINLQKLFGISHGKVYYKNLQNENETIEYGQYKFNLKNGQWKSIDGQVGTYLFGKQIGLWQTFNKKDKIGQGYYDFQNKKVGKWIEPVIYNSILINNCSWEGIYNEGRRIDEWNLIFNNEKIAGGFYDEKGQKKTLWKDFIINENFQRLGQSIIWEEEYQNGIKQGNWTINYKEKEGSLFEKIGYGFFNQNGLKDQKWQEINEDLFCLKHQVIWQGEYKCGKRIKKWNIKFRNDGEGEYNQDGAKVGKWKDINENKFNIDHSVIWQGEYKNGKKVGIWNFYYRFDFLSEFKKIGGGCFNEQGEKHGFWIDISEDFFSWSHQVIWEGEYINGIKVGNWKIKFRNDDYEQFKEIGNGNYNQQGKKYQEWRDINEKMFNRNHQVFWQGKYLEGIKIGYWSIFIRDINEEIKQIDGGEFNNQGLKIGDWKDIEENQFKKFDMKIQEGEYKEGLKVGKWRILKLNSLNQEFELIENVYFDDSGKKLHPQEIFQIDTIVKKIQLNN